MANTTPMYGVQRMKLLLDQQALRNSHIVTTANNIQQQTGCSRSDALKAADQLWGGIRL